MAIKKGTCVPPEYINANELAETLACSPRWAQALIKRTPDRYKIKIGRTIYARCEAIDFPVRRGNPHFRSSLFQSYVSACRWHPEQRDELEIIVTRLGMKK